MPLLCRHHSNHFKHLVRLMKTRIAFFLMIVTLFSCSERKFVITKIGDPNKFYENQSCSQLSSNLAIENNKITALSKAFRPGEVEAIVGVDLGEDPSQPPYDENKKETQVAVSKVKILAIQLTMDMKHCKRVRR